MTRKMADYSSRDSPYRSNEWARDGYSPNIGDTLRILKVEIRICKVDNERIIQSQERFSRAHDKQEKFNAIILHILSDLQRHRHPRINYG